MLKKSRFSGLNSIFQCRYQTIEGHTDVIGDQNMNKTLSEERAIAVAQYLIQHGIDENRIVSVGYGSTRPIVTDSVKMGNRVNRRVAFIIK